MGVYTGMGVILVWALLRANTVYNQAVGRFLHLGQISGVGLFRTVAVSPSDGCKHYTWLVCSLLTVRITT